MRGNSNIAKFTAIPKTVFNDQLSAEAIGILCYLLSKPPDWRYRRELICRDTNTPLARFKRAMAELETSGYVFKVSVYDTEQKKLAGKDYLVSATKQLPTSKMIFARIGKKGEYLDTPTLDFDRNVEIFPKSASTGNLTEGAISRPSVLQTLDKTEGRQTEASITEASVTEASVLGGAYIRLEGSKEENIDKTTEREETDLAKNRRSENETFCSENKFEDSDVEVLTDPDFVPRFTIPRLRKDFNAPTFIHPDWNDDDLAGILQACASYYLANNQNFRNWIEKAKYWLKNEKQRHREKPKPKFNLEEW